MKLRAITIFILIINAGPLFSEIRTETTVNVPVEITFIAETVPDHPDQLELDVLFQAPSGRRYRVPAFWAGGILWKVRYASAEAGKHQFVSVLEEGLVDGLGQVEGTVIVYPYTGDNPLYQHGSIRVTDDKRHFEQADGEPFFWLGDTWWMGLSKRLKWPEGFQALANDRKQKGFTLVQIVGGLPPDMRPLDPRGAGDGGQAWTDGFTSIRPEFYNAADKRIQYLVEAGLVPCIVAAWKDYMPVMGVEKMKRHWRNLIARYGAYPVIWILGGEINRTDDKFLDGKAGTIPNNPDAYRAAWTEVAAYLKSIDPYDRILGTHNQGDYRVLDDPGLLDMYFLQSGHSALFSISAQTEWFEELYHADRTAPLVMSEANYQGLFDESSYWDQLQRHQFWVTVLEGGAGHTYGGNGIWQVNVPGKPFGASPHGFVWGETPWPRAMGHLASTQLGLSKDFIMQSDWQKMVPASEKVAFESIDLPAFNESRAQWIWPEKGTKGLVAMATSIKLPSDGEIRRAVLRIACKAPYELSVNGQMVHRIFSLDVSDSLRHTEFWEFPLLGEYLEPGRNILRLRFDEDDFVRGVALAAHAYVEMTDGSIEEVVSDPSWRWTNPDSGWPGDFLKLDPAMRWDRVAVNVSNNKLPDNREFRQFRTYGPRCAEIPGREWLVFSPASFPVAVSGLPKRASLELTLLNPRNGEVKNAETVMTDRQGKWTFNPPNEYGDWVLRLRK